MNETSKWQIVEKTQPLDFSFVSGSQLLTDLTSTVEQGLDLYRQGFYEQMATTLRQGLEVVTDLLAQLNSLPTGPDWQRANLSLRLGYFGVLHLLPRRILTQAFSIKNFGNLGSHANSQVDFNQMSALADLRQLHDLLAYLVNTYEKQAEKYDDIKIQEEAKARPTWYQQPQLKQPVLSFGQYLLNRDKHWQNKEAGPKKVRRRWPIWAGIVAGVLILAGILGAALAKPSDHQASVSEEAAILTDKQRVALGLVYARHNLDQNWQRLHLQGKVKVRACRHYTFSNVEVSTQGGNQIYVIKPQQGLAVAHRQGKLFIVFFDQGQANMADQPCQRKLTMMLAWCRRHHQEANWRRLSERLQVEK